MNVIVAFPKIENARSIKSILVKHGFQVGKVCVTGAQVLQYADGLADGIVVCASRLQDMVYAQLREYLPPGFEMLVLAPPNAWEESTPEGGLPLFTEEQHGQRHRADGNGADDLEYDGGIGCGISPICQNVFAVFNSIERKLALYEVYENAWNWK